ncbi:MAG TPA: hypothetical protein ENK78_07830 [Thiothrix sp.]|nr:hypothetical protein [Thiothrix sp.]
MASFIMSGKLQAILFVLLTALASFWFPPFILLSAAATSLIALRKGWQAALPIMGIGAIGLIALAQLMNGQIQNELQTIFLQWLPLLFFAVLLTRTVSWQAVLQTMFMLALAGVALMYMFIPDTEGFWQAQLMTVMQPMVDSKQQTQQEAINNAKLMAMWASGAMMAGLTVFWLITLFMARHWQAQLYEPDGFSVEFRALNAGKLPALIIVALILFIVISQSVVAINLLIAGMMVFLFHALGLIHGLVRQLNMHGAWLIGIYVFLLLALQVALVLLIAFALIDSFANFRKKLKPKH